MSKRPDKNRSCSSVGLDHVWRYMEQGTDAALTTLLPGGPWYKCRVCHFVTKPQLQPEGWRHDLH